jgi:hypothetical protein
LTLNGEWQVSKTLTRKDFACPDGCGFDTIDIGLYYFLISIEENLEKMGLSLVISKACVCENYNRLIKDATDSTHLLGRSVDICVPSSISAMELSGSDLLKLVKSIKGNELYEIYLLDTKSINKDGVSIHIGSISI